MSSQFSDIQTALIPSFTAVALYSVFDGSEELYDHEADLREYRNLAGDQRLDEIKRDLARWLPEVKIPYRPE